MDKRAFRLVTDFMKRNWKVVLLLIVLMLGISFGERQLSNALQAADLQAIDVGIAVIRMFLQTALSTILVFLWHKQNDSAASFSVTDILKLFVPNLLVTVLLALCVVLVVTIPLAIWLFLRLDFYMNEYITGRASGMFSCIRSSFRSTKGLAGKYFVYNVKYLLFYFLVEFALSGVTIFSFLAIPESSQLALDVFDIVFLSVFMPYRFLIKCGFYTMRLQGQREEA